MSLIGKIYGEFYKEVFKGAINWETDAFKVVLLKDAYTVDLLNHKVLNDLNLVANEATGTNYVSGGETLTNKGVTYEHATRKVNITADDIQWDNSSISARYAVLYKDTGDGATSTLVKVTDFTETKTSTNSIFKIAWGTSVITETLMDS